MYRKERNGGTFDDRRPGRVEAGLCGSELSEVGLLADGEVLLSPSTLFCCRTARLSFKVFKCTLIAIDTVQI